MQKAFDNDMERSGFLPGLREKIRSATGINIETTKEMYKVCNYLHWMLRSNVPLRIDLTRSERSRIDICKERRVFKKYCGFFE